MPLTPFLAAQAGRIAAGALALALFAAAKATTGYPEVGDAGVRFETLMVGAPERAGDRSMRPVNPRYDEIRRWISAVGAAVAIADLDGDGRPNDLCHVETRDDSVTVLPAPGTGARYRPFRLDLHRAGYAPDTVAPMGCLAGDYNEDGKADLLVYFWGRPPLLYHGAGGVPAAEHMRPVELVAAREAWYTNAALQADVDGDGRADLVFGNYFPGHARVLDAAATDGGTMQKSMSRAFNGGGNRLFLRDLDSDSPSGFTDHSAALTPAMANGWTLALAAADLDGDLLPEIYVANDFGPDRMLVNRSSRGAPAFSLATAPRSFSAPRSRTLGRDSFKGMGAEFADVNGDGLLDLAVSNIAQEYALLESHFLFVNQGRPEALKRGTAAFVDESGPRGVARNGWGWDVKAADFDNDGTHELVQALGFMSGNVDRWPELQELATANDDLIAGAGVWGPFSGDADISGRQLNRLYARGAGEAYRDVGLAAGLTQRGVTRGIAIADVDLDGRLDLAFARQWGASSLMRNRTASPGAFLSLDLRLPNANGTSRPAFGAVAYVARAGAAPRVEAVDGGNGHSGKRAPLLHFGLGDARGAVETTILWRDAAGLHRARARLAPGHHRILLGKRSQT